MLIHLIAQLPPSINFPVAMAQFYSHSVANHGGFLQSDLDAEVRYKEQQKYLKKGVLTQCLAEKPHLFLQNYL